MPPGDLITANYQYEFRGLLFGSGTDYLVESVTGLLGMPDVQADDFERADAHGFFPGTPRSAGRTIDIDLVARGNGQVDTEDKLDLMYATFVLDPEFEPFVFQRPGRGKRVIYARTYRRSFESNYQTARGLAEGAVMLRAADPRIYSLAVTQTQFTVAETQASGTATVTNVGTFGTAPRITVSGQADNPVITNQTTGRALRLNVTNVTNDSLVINFKTRTITKNGVDVTAAVIRNDSQWWELVSGANLIQFSRTGTVGSPVVTIEHQDAWL